MDKTQFALYLIKSYKEVNAQFISAQQSGNIQDSNLAVGQMLALEQVFEKQFNKNIEKFLIAGEYSVGDKVRSVFNEYAYYHVVNINDNGTVNVYSLAQDNDPYSHFFPEEDAMCFYKE